MYDEIFEDNKQIYFFENSLIVEIYTVGYSKQGESIIVLIKTDGKVRYSGVIDCYEKSTKKKQNNITKKILDDNKVENLDFICWTHPDLDHSKGLDKIMNEYTDENTLFWLPAGVYSNERGKEKLENIFKEVDKKAEIGNLDSAQTGHELLYQKEIIFSNKYETYKLYAKALTPIPSMIYMKKKNKTYRPNDYSVSFCMGVICNEKRMNCRFLFTGDVEDDAIKSGIMPNIKKDSEFNFLKIPHHGSSSSESLSDYIGKCEYACSTVFRLGKANDPEKEIMEKYNRKIHKMFITNKSNPKRGMYYGVVKVMYDIVNQKTDEEYEKDAYEYKNIIE